MIQTISNIVRLSGLMLVMIGYGIPFKLLQYAMLTKHDHTKRNAVLQKLGAKLARLMQISGPSFIKLGQILSTRPDLTGEIISLELTKLQDKLTPFAFSEVKEQIESAFNADLTDLFSHINEESVAAASIAQVHKATTKSGDIVAVKILRPDIEKRFQADLQLFGFFVSFAEMFFGKYITRLRLRDVLKTLAEIVQFELDLKYEAASADEIRENTKNDEGIRIPKVYWDLTSTRVLTTEWINGTPIDDREALVEQGFDLHEIAKKLSVAFFNQAYRDGFFHADLHPGNIFVDENGDIVMVDFGIIGILSKEDRVYIAEILYGFIERDYQRVSDIHFEAGYVPSTKSRKLFALACRGIGEPIVGLPVNKVSIALLLKQLFEVTKQFEMETQTQLLLLQKTMVTIEGVGYTIYPDVNMWQLAEPWIKNWANENFGVQARVKDVANEAVDIIKDLPKLYRDFRKILRNM